MTEQKPWFKMMSRSPRNNPKDFFPTPPLTTLCLFSQMSFGGLSTKIWEPACGDGAMSEVIKRLGYTVRSSDKFDYGYDDGQIIDFTNVLPVQGEYDIITNPPYNIHLEWIEKSLAIAKRYVALLFPLVYLPPKNKRQWITEFCGFSLIVPGWRSKFVMPGRTKASGMKDYAWFVWDKEKPSSPVFPTALVDKYWVEQFAEDYDIKV